MSEKFFSNKDCKYYPCHNTSEELNCLFCYCPIFFFECQGKWEKIDGIKDCSNCVYPHKAENYDDIVEALRQKIEWEKHKRAKSYKEY